MQSRWKLSAAMAAILLLALSVGVAPALAAEASLTGHWEGAVEIPGTKLGVDLDFSQENGAWKGDISIPQQKAKDLPLKNIQQQGTAVSFEIEGVPGSPTFKGTLSADGETVAGDFSQGGGTFPFGLKRAAAVAPAEAAKEALAGYDELVAKSIADFQVPGLAVAIVKGGEVVYAKGFGYRDVEKKLPVTADTLFAIGSTTKAFTAFILGTLVDEGKLDWDEPVRTFLPGFRLYDEDRHRADDAARPGDPPLRPAAPRSGLVQQQGLDPQGPGRPAALPGAQRAAPREMAVQQPDVPHRRLPGRARSRARAGKTTSANASSIPLGMTNSNFSVVDSQKRAATSPCLTGRTTTRRKSS